MRCNIHHLMALKAQREKRRLSLHTVAREAGVSYYTLSAIANERAREYPREALIKLCLYFGCNVGDLLEIVEIPDALAPDAQ